MGAGWCGLTLMAVRRSCSSSLSLSEKDKLPGLVSSSFCRCPSVGTGRGREEEGREVGKEGGREEIRKRIVEGVFSYLPPSLRPQGELVGIAAWAGGPGPSFITLAPGRSLSLGLGMHPALCVYPRWAEREILGSGTDYSGLGKKPVACWLLATG